MASQADATQKIATDPGFIKLQTILEKNPVSSWIIPDDPTVPGTNSPGTNPMTYDELKNIPPSTLDLASYASYSLMCTDHIYDGVGASSPPLVGLSKFDTAARAPTACGPGTYYTSNQWGCGDKIDSTGKSALCKSVANYLDHKWELSNPNAEIYQCPLFEDPADPTASCDVTVGTVFKCLKNGQVKIKKKPCNLQVLETYIKGFSQRLEEVFKSIDNSVPATQLKISQDMKAVVEKNIIQPVIKIADGSTCNFIGKTYKGMISAGCYQGAYGAIAIANGLFYLSFVFAFYVVLMYFLFRFTKDNSETQILDDNPAAKEEKAAEASAPPSPAAKIEEKPPASKEPVASAPQAVANTRTYEKKEAMRNGKAVVTLGSSEV
jgi:hypothetical protein